MRESSSCSGISDSMDKERNRRKQLRVYLFTITILKVTRIPSPMRLSFSAGSGVGGGGGIGRMPSKRTLKITVLHGSKQREIGEFDIVQDECLIDQRISCRLVCAHDDDLGKLHLYIDQAYSSGLAGHIALDLKEFLQDMDSEVYIKYPLSASSPREGYVPKLKMTLECTCLGNPDTQFIPDIDTIIHHKSSIAENKFMNDVARDYNSDALSLFRSDEPEGSGENCPETLLLEQLQDVLVKLDTKLKTFVDTCKSDDEKDIPVDSSSTVTKRTIVEESDCTDCAVCSTGLLDKFDAVSPGLCRTDDEPTVCSKPMESELQQQQVEESQPEQKQQEKLETKNRPGILGQILGGMLLVGLSVFAVKTISKNEGRVFRKDKDREEDR